MITFQTTVHADQPYPFTLVEFSLGESGICEPADLAELEIPQLPGDQGIVISGRGPIWLFAAIAHHYHVAQWVGTFDPRLGGAVVVSTHHRQAPPVGSVVPVPKSE